MAFVVEDFEDLVQLLEQHPEWRLRLRPLILGPEWEAIPSRLEDIEKVLKEVAAEQVSLGLRQAGFETRLDRFEERSDRVERTLAHLSGRVGNVEGDLLERKYRDNYRSWFSRYLKKAELVFLDGFDELDVARAAGRVSEAQARRLEDLDLLVRGRETATGIDGVVLAVEISYTINVDDVERAHQAVDTLIACGLTARSFVGGYRISDSARLFAERHGTIVDLRRPPTDFVDA